jgi:phosphate transport system permease protein
MSSSARSGASPAVLSKESTARLRRWRMFKDGAARHFVGIGGVGVIIAILLIFFYLIWVVVPLFRGAEMHVVQRFAVPGDGETLHLAIEEQAEIGIRYTDKGNVVFFATENGAVISDMPVRLPANARIVSRAAAAPSSGLVALGLSNGQVAVVKTAIAVSYPDGVRRLTPRIEFPLGDAPISMDKKGRPISALAAQVDGDRVLLVGGTDDNRLLLTSFEREQAMLGEEGDLVAATIELPAPALDVSRLLLDPELRLLYVVEQGGFVTRWSIVDRAKPKVEERLNLADPGTEVTSLEFLSGGISLLVGMNNGTIAQWFPVRDKAGNTSLTRIRDFRESSAAVTGLAPEFSRKGFVAADSNGYLTLYHATAERTVLITPAASTALRRVAIAPRANALLTEDANRQIAFWTIDNEHPEISWSSLWGKVWYESYEEPKWLWQSSAATNIFEPKFSLTPLSFGTLKAAFYAMLIAAPLSILGAIYTAHFMAPRMRGYVKPTIEIMEALPTVILGFLAGLWLAPFVEKFLPGVFSALIIMPLGVLLFAYLWQQLPAPVRSRVPEGWQAALLVPVVLLLTWGALAASPAIEAWLFGGDMRLWLANDMGVTFDQRNAVIVGLAMGFAVVPNIFSIAEDAIFSVPGHLVRGSLALGATPWQTLWRVVLLTASPGIFSAVMIGLGRAVGETMIVLMATGNTPVMDLSIFQGMRTLSANIAVEMPESEVNSTHFRVLFLAALVLFMFTFAFNTAAEVVRQRLRRKYSSL